MEALILWVPRGMKGSDERGNRRGRLIEGQGVQGGIIEGACEIKR